MTYTATTTANTPIAVYVMGLHLPLASAEIVFL
jgi:hypothetical protein